jgi:cephalosporin hydroxylase
MRQCIRYEVLTAVTVRNMFWALTPFNSVEIYQRFGGNYHLHFRSQRVSKTRKMKVIASSETSVDSYQITRSCIPEDRISYMRCVGLRLRI